MQLTKLAQKGNILTPPPQQPTKMSNNHDDDPSQRDRLDIKPGRVMKMPFICPSDVMIAAELMTENGGWRGECGGGAAKSQRCDTVGSVD